MSLKRGFFTFGGWTLASRVVGFIRDLLTAMVLGAGPLADAFIVAQRLPNLFRSLFAEGALSAAFVPLFTKHRAEEGDEAARRFAAETNAVMLTALCIFSVLMIVGMPWVLRVIAPGFYDEPDKFAIAVLLSQIIFPYLLLISLTALQGGVLNALGRLAPFAAAPVLYNVIQIMVLAVLVPQAQNMGDDLVKILASFVLIGGIVQWILLAWCCHKAGFPVRFVRPRLTPGVKTFLRRLGPGAVGAGAAQFNMAVSTILASLLPTGTVAYVYYADRLNQLPLGVIGVAISMALLPLLSQAVQDNNPSAIRNSLSRAIDIGLLFGMPAAVALMVMGEAILEVLFVRGAFTSADAQATAAVLVGYAVGIPAFILVKVLATRFFAGHDTQTPVRSALVTVAANIAFSVWLMPWLGAFGIVLSTSLASWVNFLLLRWRLKQKGQLTLDDLCLHRLPRIVLAAVAMGVVIWALVHMFGHYMTGQALLLEGAVLVAIVGAGMTVYLGGLMVTGTFRLAELKQMLTRRKNVAAISGE